jgi:hypothetical protein
MFYQVCYNLYFGVPQFDFPALHFALRVKLLLLQYRIFLLYINIIIMHIMLLPLLTGHQNSFVLHPHSFLPSFLFVFSP